ncbi:hypothetical protein Q9L58_009726 [Maublancomyces gigas]|uniref:Uncharacterized protein n=1 Tax=Discina gigas TaxID=1032678 RepID=A0ABR3G621_9PEZI
MAGGPSVGREYVKKCLEDVAILRQRDCKITGKWTPSNQNIPGNASADTLTKAGSKKHPPHGHAGPITWDSLTNTDIRPKELVRFMAQTGLLRIRYIRNEEDARDKGYEISEDI